MGGRTHGVGVGERRERALTWTRRGRRGRGEWVGCVFSFFLSFVVSLRPHHTGLLRAAAAPAGTSEDNPSVGCNFHFQGGRMRCGRGCAAGEWRAASNELRPPPTTVAIVLVVVRRHRGRSKPSFPSRGHGTDSCASSPASTPRGWSSPPW